MALLQVSQARHFQRTALRLGGGGGLKPRWNIPEKEFHQYTYQPTIPDKHYNIGHYNYAPITLWLRARRPSMERVITAVKGTTLDAYDTIFGSIFRFVDDQCPGFGYKCLAALGALLGYNIFVMYVVNRTDAYMNLEKLKLHSNAQKLWSSGFFESESENVDNRMQNYNTDSLEYEELWESTLAEATQTRNFNVFVNQLQPNLCHAKQPVEATDWRFNMMPYGRNSPDTQTFPQNDTVDAPAASNVFFLDMGNAGDYIERQDNKGNPIRKARHMYTTAYMPPTK